MRTHEVSLFGEESYGDGSAFTLDGEFVWSGEATDTGFEESYV